MMKTVSCIGLLAILLGGCAPALLVRHQDPKNREAEVWLNGEKVGTVRFAEELELPVEKGRHIVRVVPPGATDSPWHPDRQNIDLVMDTDAILTLFPPIGAP